MPLDEVQKAGSVPTVKPSVAYEFERNWPKYRIGVVALDTDLTLEADLHRLLPRGLVATYVNRVPVVNPVTPENLRTMGPHLKAVAAQILPGIDVDVVIYGCTSGTVNIGPEAVAREIQAAKPGAAVVTPATAGVAGLKSLGARSITLVTPYLDSVNQTMRAFFEGEGIRVLNIAGFGLESDYDMSYIPPAALKAAAVEACHPEADAVFLSCTAIRAAEVLDEIEAAIGRPALSSNQCLVWDSLRQAGYAEPISGAGRLLAAPRTR